MKSATRTLRLVPFGMALLVFLSAFVPANGQMNQFLQGQQGSSPDTAGTAASDTAGMGIRMGSDTLAQHFENVRQRYQELFQRREIAFSAETFTGVITDLQDTLTGGVESITIGTQWIARYFSDWMHLFTFALGILLIIALAFLFSPVKQRLRAVRETASQSGVLAFNTAGYLLEILLRSLPTLFVMAGILILILVLEISKSVNQLVLQIVVAIILYKLARWLLEVLFAPKEERDRVVYSETRVARYFFHLGRSLLQWTLLYGFIHIALQFIDYRPDFLAFIRFVYRIGAILLFAFLFARRDFTLALFPQPERPAFRRLLRFFSTIYYPVYAILLFTGLMSILGYTALSGFIFSRTLIALAVILIGILLNRILYDALDWLIPESRREMSGEVEDEKQAKFWDRLHTLSQFAVSLILIMLSVVILLKSFWILGRQSIPEALINLFSFTLFQIQDTPITPWSLIKAVLVIIAFIYASRYLRRFLKRRVLEKTTLDIGARHAILTITHYIILIIAILIALETVGIQLTTLKIFAGALGLGIGFGLQNIANNFVSGLIILFERPVKSKDFVEVGDILGTITRISARSTTILTRDNIAIIVPNSNFIEQTVVNWSLNDTPTRVHVPIGVKYGSDVEKVRDILTEIAYNHPRVLNYPQPRVWFQEFAESSLNFDLLIWINDPQEGINNIRSDINFKINKRFQEAGIGIPFPQRDVHIKVDQEDYSIIRRLVAKNASEADDDGEDGTNE